MPPSPPRSPSQRVGFQWLGWRVARGPALQTELVNSAPRAARETFPESAPGLREPRTCRRRGTRWAGGRAARDIGLGFGGAPALTPTGAAPEGSRSRLCLRPRGHLVPGLGALPASVDLSVKWEQHSAGVGWVSGCQYSSSGYSGRPCRPPPGLPVPPGHRAPLGQGPRPSRTTGGAWVSGRPPEPTVSRAPGGAMPGPLSREKTQVGQVSKGDSVYMEAASGVLDAERAEAPRFV